MPYFAAIAGLLVAGRISDRTVHRGWVVAGALFGLGDSGRFVPRRDRAAPPWA